MTSPDTTDRQIEAPALRPRTGQCWELVEKPGGWLPDGVAGLHFRTAGGADQFRVDYQLPDTAAVARQVEQRCWIAVAACGYHYHVDMQSLYVVCWPTREDAIRDLLADGWTFGPESSMRCTRSNCDQCPTLPAGPVPLEVPGQQDLFDSQGG